MAQLRYSFRESGWQLLTAHREYFRSFRMDGREMVADGDGEGPLEVRLRAGDKVADVELRDLEDFGGMFMGCQGLVGVSDDLFGGCGKARFMERVFARSGLEEVPQWLFDPLTGIESLSCAFYKCARLREVPLMLIRSLPYLRDVSYMFSGCLSVERLPDWFFRCNPELQDLSFAFSYMEGLKEVPKHIFSGLKAVRSLKGLFCGCGQLKRMPGFDLTQSGTLRDASYMFALCRQLEMTGSAVDGCFAADVKKDNILIGTMGQEIEEGIDRDAVVREDNMGL